MLKLHDFECPACHYAKEELCDVPPNLMSVQCHKCGALMEHVVIGGKSFIFKGFWHEHLSHKPIYIDSWSTYKKELKERNLRNEYL